MRQLMMSRTGAGVVIRLKFTRWTSAASGANAGTRIVAGVRAEVRVSYEDTRDVGWRRRICRVAIRKE